MVTGHNSGSLLCLFPRSPSTHEHAVLAHRESRSSSFWSIPSDRLRKAGALLAEDHHGDEDDHAPRGAERSSC